MTERDVLDLWAEWRAKAEYSPVQTVGDEMAAEIRRLRAWKEDAEKWLFDAWQVATALARENDRLREPEGKEARGWAVHDVLRRLLEHTAGIDHGNVGQTDYAVWTAVDEIMVATREEPTTEPSAEVEAQERDVVSAAYDAGCATAQRMMTEHAESAAAEWEASGNYREAGALRLWLDSRPEPTSLSAEVEGLVRKARSDTLDALRVRHGILGVMKEAVDEMTDCLLVALSTKKVRSARSPYDTGYSEDIIARTKGGG